MRITTGIMVRNLLYNVHSRAERITTLQNQLASGRRVQRPSQDPSGTMSAMRMSTALVELGQYLDNIADGRGWLDAAEHALGATVTALQRAAELAVQGASGALTAGDRELAAVEVDQLVSGIMDLANTRHGELYLFSGHQTGTLPFPTIGSYAGDHGSILRDVGPGGAVLQVNLSGDRAFNAPLAAVAALADLLRDNDQPGIMAALGQVRDALDSTLAHLADVGGRMQRADFLENRLREVQTGITAAHSRVSDVDLAETIMHLRTQESAYQTALGSAGRFLPVSLLDYLR